MRKVHTFSVSPSMVAPLLLVLGLGVASAFIFPYLTIIVIIVAYVIHIPFAVRSKRWFAQHPEAWDPQARGSAEHSDGRSAGRSRTVGDRWLGSVCVAHRAR